jgi:hypothetical protein
VQRQSFEIFLFLEKILRFCMFFIFHDFGREGVKRSLKRGGGGEEVGREGGTYIGRRGEGGREH